MSDQHARHTMSDAESLMWRLEQDPHMSSNIALVALVDRRPDIDLVRARLERATLLVPRLRQVVRTTPGNLAPPVFETDGDFDIDCHVRRIALPPPGDEAQLFDLAALAASDPFDVNRPLWQVFVVEGLRGGRAAVILKMHHTVTDGEGGVELAAHLVDLERDAVPPPIPAGVPEPDSPGGATDSATEIVNHALRLPRGVTQQVRELLADPTRLAETSSSAAVSLRSLVEELGDTESARSPLWTTRSRRRRLHAVHARLDTTKEVAARLGGTLNTAFVTVAADAAGRYHAELGSPVESLRASMAVSTRTADSGANAFSLVRLAVPTGALPIDERFEAVRAAADDAVSQSESGAMEAVSALGSYLPTPLLGRLARAQTQTVDFVTSNVKGLTTKVFIAGAELLHAYPVGPLMGTAFNVTLFSHRNQLDLGLHVDAGAVTDHQRLAELFRDAFDDFAALG